MKIPKTDALFAFLVTQFPATLGSVELNLKMIEIGRMEAQHGQLLEVVKLTDKEAVPLLRTAGLVTEATTLHGECFKALGGL